MGSFQVESNRNSKSPSVTDIEGVQLTPLKIISNPRGPVLHCLKATDREFAGFGEAYFSIVDKDAVKGWKKHKQMTLNLVVPVGLIDFALFDNRNPKQHEVRTVSLGVDNYARLTVPPGIWMAFRGQAESLNLLLNIANIPHDPDEAVNSTSSDTYLPSFEECFAKDGSSEKRKSS